MSVYQVSTLEQNDQFDGWHIRSNFSTLPKAVEYARRLAASEPTERHRVRELSPTPPTLAEFGQIDFVSSFEQETKE